MRTRKAYRLPEWAIKAIEAVATGYEITQTDALLRIIDQGHKWHLKNIAKIKEGVNPQEALSEHPQKYVDEFDEETQRNIEIAKTKWIED